MKISFIIPILNGENYIVKHREHIEKIAQLFHEIVVVDGGSKDNSESLLKGMNLTNLKFLTTTPGRGQQLNYASEEATGDFFFFNHIDSIFKTNLLEVKKKLIFLSKSDHFTRTLAFCKLVYDDDNWKANLLSKLVALRVKWLRLPYGDQGLLVSRKLYEALGGFNPSYPIMEDVDFILRAQKKKVTFLELPFKIETSFSKYDFFFFRIFRNFFCLVLFLFKVPPKKIAKIY